MFSLLLIFSTSFQLSLGGSSFVPVWTFDGKDGTTYDWTTVNDPVMGGVSHSQFMIDHENNQGRWFGAVEVVPSLQAPGFCNLQSMPLGEKAEFPDFTGAVSFVVNAMQSNSTGINKFNMMIESKGAMHLYRQGVYTANLTDFSSTMASHEVRLSDFECTWRGECVNWCPELSTQLNQITNIAVGTQFPGKAGPFDVGIESIGAMIPNNLKKNRMRRKLLKL